MIPMIKPSTTKGSRIKAFVAPTIFMMAISSLREYMASLTVLEMMNSETTNRTVTMTSEAMFSTFCTVWKPSAISKCATTSATPSICVSLS